MLSRKKVGVLTFHRCINYGSYWQARQLVEGLRNLGYDAVLLDHVSPLVNVAEWRVALQPTLPVRAAPEDVKAYGCKVRKFLAEFAALPLSRPFDLQDPSQMEVFDALVIGSDEVWNLRHPWYAGKPIFFGEGLRAERVVSYAASFGNYSCWEGIGRPWTDMLAKLDAISVRDENSWWMLKNSLGIEPTMVLDPCLQFPPVLEGTWTGPKEPFALVYGHNFSAPFAAQTVRWAKENKLKLLSIGYRNDWADHQWLAAGPHDFAHAMANAKAVITDFFHGCVFSLVNDKPFACEISEYRSIKVRGLMEHLQGQDRLVTEDSPEVLDHLLAEPPSEEMKRRIVESRETSLQFLTSALAESHVS